MNTWDAYQNVKSEGLLMLYRGVKPPLLQAAVSKSIMFGLYNWYDEMLVDRFGHQRGIHLLAAGLSGTTEAVLAPFEVRLSTRSHCLQARLTRLSLYSARRRCYRRPSSMARSLARTTRSCT